MLHLGLMLHFSRNIQPTVLWMDHIASKTLVVAGQLVGMFAPWIKKAMVSLVTPLWNWGAESLLADVLLWLFGRDPTWHCKSNNNVLPVSNTLYPLPNQSSWTVFHPSCAILLRVCFMLQMKATNVEERPQLKSVSRHVDKLESL